jgi:hypothetical protein
MNLLAFRPVGVFHCDNINETLQEALVRIISWRSSNRDKKGLRNGGQKSLGSSALGGDVSSAVSGSNSEQHPTSAGYPSCGLRMPRLKRYGRECGIFCWTLAATVSCGF